MEPSQNGGIVSNKFPRLAERYDRGATMGCAIEELALLGNCTLLSSSLPFLV
jgi:hypothetical protein